MQYRTKPFIINSVTNTADWKKNKQTNYTPSSFTHSVYGQHYPSFLACNCGIWGNRAEAACQLNTLTMRHQCHLLSPTWSFLRGHVCKKSFSPTQFHFHVPFSPFVGTVCVDIPGFLQFPQYGKVCLSSQTLLLGHASLLLLSWLTFLDYSGQFFFFYEQHFISLTPFSSRGVLSQPASDSGCRNQVFSWNLDLCLWVSAWRGWARSCPCPLDPGPSPGSSPCSATCGSPCWCRGWAARSPRPLLKQEVTGQKTGRFQQLPWKSVICTEANMPRTATRTKTITTNYCIINVGLCLSTGT